MSYLLFCDQLALYGVPILLLLLTSSLYTTYTTYLRKSANSYTDIQLKTVIPSCHYNICGQAWSQHLICP